MAFNHEGHYWLKNGASIWITYKNAPHGVGEDLGAQWIQANPEPFDTFPAPSGTIQLETGRFQKRAVYENGGLEISYIVLVENTESPGWLDTYFDLDGGGNT
jgi:hypothetical protein